MEIDYFYELIAKSTNLLIYAKTNLHSKQLYAMEYEYDSIIRNYTQKIFNLSISANLIIRKQMYKIKVGFNGQLTQLKTKIVAHKYQQIVGLDYFKIFVFITNEIPFILCYLWQPIIIRKFLILMLRPCF